MAMPPRPASTALTGILFCLCIAMAPMGPLSAGDLPPTPFILSKPAGDGPFPAVVILHDCSGLGPRSSGAPARWARQLMQDGYVTIQPDSFSQRRHPRGVCVDGSPPIVRFTTRAADAYTALKYLQSLPFVDPRRIAVMGGSHGGSSTLAAIVDVPKNAAAKPGFAAAIALYPGCGRRYGNWSVKRGKEPGSPITGYSGVFKPLAPLLILIGELDDWTPPEPCHQLAAAAQAAGYPVEIKIYAGARHSFDNSFPARFRVNRRNFNAVGGHGATTGGNPQAWADAIVRVKAFLREHLAAPPSPR
jgi:dienelactone hydrolase